MARLLRVPRLARRLGFVLAIALSARPAIVSAQPAAKPAAKETKEETSPEYRRHMENGVKLYKAGDFVGALGGGLAIDLMSYDDLTTCAPRCDDTYGIDFYITTDAGTEISIGGVLLGASLTFTVNGTKGSDDFTDDETKALRQPYENRVLPMFGPRVHFGYAFW